MAVTDELLIAHAGAWRGIVEHPFLAGIAGGRLERAAFARWLEQDYHFVAALISFVEGLVSRLGSEPQLSALLAGALPVLRGELELFKREAPAYGADVLNSAIHPDCRAYNGFLDGLWRTEPPGNALLAYWALEQAYFDGWSFVGASGRAHASLSGFIENWTCPEFGDYVEALRLQTDRLLGEAPSQSAEQLFLRIVELEGLFWDIGMQA